MCLPAAAAIPLMIASTAVSAAGQVQGGLQARAQGRYEAKVADMNRGLSVDAYQQERTSDVQNRTDFWRKVSAMKGQQIASMAANGLDVNYGAAERVQSDTSMLAQEDANRLSQQDTERAKGHLIEASNYKAQGVAALQRGKDAFTSSLFGAGSTVLGGLTQASLLRASAATAKAPR